jgi:hypothetical protein
MEVKSKLPTWNLEKDPLFKKVHNRLFNANFEVKFKEKTPETIWSTKKEIRGGYGKQDPRKCTLFYWECEIFNEYYNACCNIYLFQTFTNFDIYRVIKKDCLSW